MQACMFKILIIVIASRYIPDSICAACVSFTFQSENDAVIAILKRSKKKCGENNQFGKLENRYHDGKAISLSTSLYIISKCKLCGYRQFVWIAPDLHIRN